MAAAYKVTGANTAAPFTLTVHRGEGMVLLAMDWKAEKPSTDFVGFAIEYHEPGKAKFLGVKNRLNFDGNAGSASSEKRPPTYSTLVAPIQKFRWVHFPYNPEVEGLYTYRVTPVFMAADGTLSHGAPQTAEIALGGETYPGVLNVAFTRGFVSSQAFVDRYGTVDALLPEHSGDGLSFRSDHPQAEEAYRWMGFEARRVVLAALDDALADSTAEVGVVAYDLDLPELIERIIKLKGRIRVIIDNSEGHSGPGHAEDRAEAQLVAAGIPVLRQHMTVLQHNKTLYVRGSTVKRAIFGSTNMSWRGFYVQSNNAVLIHGQKAADIAKAAFEDYWLRADGFKRTPSTEWIDFGIDGIDAKVSYSPHGQATSRLKGIAADVVTARSSVFYSLAFLWQTPGLIRKALADRTNAQGVFVAGISEKKTDIVVAGGGSNLPPVRVEPLDDDVPEPFRSEPTGLVGNSVGTRMHHKFIVLDFDTPEARVYLGSYNMSVAADGSNGENLLLIRDPRVATSYMVEAVRIIDHYQFRVARKTAEDRRTVLKLCRPPADAETAWFEEDWSEPHKISDRLLFSR